MAGEGRPRTPVTVADGSRLAELMARYDGLKAAAEEATARFKDLTDAIKAEAAAGHPGASAMTLAGGPGLPALSLTWVQRWSIDSRALKEAEPLTYVRYARQSGRWELRAL